MSSLLEDGFKRFSPAVGGIVKAKILAAQRTQATRAARGLSRFHPIAKSLEKPSGLPLSAGSDGKSRTSPLRKCLNASDIQQRPRLLLHFSLGGAAVAPSIPGGKSHKRTYSS